MSMSDFATTNIVSKICNQYFKLAGKQKYDSGIGPMLTYPIAAAKQSGMEPWEEVRNDYSPSCDIEISFNKDVDWYFGPEEIGPNSVDFNLVAAKEITHGLGFDSNLQRTPAAKDKAFLMPKRHQAGDPSVSESKLFSYMSPLDNLSFGSKVSNVECLKYYLNCQTSISTTEMAPISAIFKKFEEIGLFTKPAVIIARLRSVPTSMRLFTSINYDKFEARIDNSTILPLNSTRFGQVADSMANTAEYLMVSTEMNIGRTLTELMANYGGLYGPMTLAVMEQTGYSSRSNPKKFNLVKEQRFL